ncbi:unnamed protein product [Lupinus luteus]|uniref:Calponin-homology (CH) domain-containing protein n=1 Tax=Lupinus luteus TaxID=3873 RepID=A0AAV1W140_LUPLU
MMNEIKSKGTTAKNSSAFLKAATTTLLHTISESEKSSYVAHINNYLGGDEFLNKYLPINPLTNDLFEIAKDGIQLLADLNLRKTPQLVELVSDSKDMEELMSLSPEKILLRWMNFHLKKTGYKKIVTNFSSDVKGAEAYAHLLNVLAPEFTNPPTLAVKNPFERAKLVLEHADKMGCKRYLTARDIVEGSPNLNLAFVAHIFQHRNGLPTQTKQSSLLETLPGDNQDSREETAFSLWINSFGNSTYINDVFEDVRNGWVLLETLDKVSPAIVNWKIANKPPIRMPFKKLRTVTKS